MPNLRSFATGSPHFRILQLNSNQIHFYHGTAMYAPVIVDIVTFFYPIGNTPAVQLTRDLPPEQPADILLLGCGDVRNILFTVHTDHDSSL